MNDDGENNFDVRTMKTLAKTFVLLDKKFQGFSKSDEHQIYLDKKKKPGELILVALAN